jgi:hypothetical protein
MSCQEKQLEDNRNLWCPKLFFIWEIWGGDLHVRFVVFFLDQMLIYEWYIAMPTLLTKIKRVIAWWTMLIIMNDGGCTLVSAKVTNQTSSRWWLNHHVSLTYRIIVVVPPIRSQNRCPVKEANQIRLTCLNDGMMKHLHSTLSIMIWIMWFYLYIHYPI